MERASAIHYIILNSSKAKRLEGLNLIGLCDGQAAGQCVGLKGGLDEWISCGLSVRKIAQIQCGPSIYLASGKLNGRAQGVVFNLTCQTKLISSYVCFH